MRIKFFLLLFLIKCNSAIAAEVDPIRDIACPDGWSPTDRIIPVIQSDGTVDKWPWGIAPSTDSADAREHIASANPIQTSDGTDLTSIEYPDDLLTIASECLVYRNLLVDGEEYFPPSPSVRRNAATGFILASAF